MVPEYLDTYFHTRYDLIEASQQDFWRFPMYCHTPTTLAGKSRHVTHVFIENTPIYQWFGHTLLISVLFSYVIANQQTLKT